MEVVLDPQDSPGEINSSRGGAGLKKLDCLLLHLFLSSFATGIVLVTAVAEYTSCGVHQLRSTVAATQWRGPRSLNIVVVLAVVHGLLGLYGSERAVEPLTLSPSAPPPPPLSLFSRP